MIMIITKTYCCLKGKHTQHFDNPREEGPASALQGKACGHSPCCPGTQSAQGWGQAGACGCREPASFSDPTEACLYGSSADEAEPAQRRLEASPLLRGELLRCPGLRADQSPPRLHTEC